MSGSTCVRCEDWECLGVPAKAVCIVWQDNCIAKSHVVRHLLQAAVFHSRWVLGVLRLKQADFLPVWVCGQTLGWSLKVSSRVGQGQLAARQLKADGICSSTWE